MQPPLTDTICMQALEAYAAAGHSIAGAARALGIPESTARHRIRTGRARGLTATGRWRGPAEIPQGMAMTKTTVQYDAAGEVVQEWRRLCPDAHDIQDAVQALVDRAAEHPRRRIPRPRTPASGRGRCLVIPIGDMHLGCLSWAEETGADYDMTIGCQLLTGGVWRVLAEAGPVERIILINLGDLVHADNRLGITERGGHHLDTDSRYQRVASRTVLAMVDAIDQCAARAPTEVITAKGNHDWHASTWLPLALRGWYRHSRHITIRTDATERIYWQWCDILGGVTHGHLSPARDLVAIMAQEQPQAWAQARTRVWHQGHIHHSKAGRTPASLIPGNDEYQDVLVEYFPILPPRDAHAAGIGYSSRRVLQGIIYQAGVGEIDRRTVHAHQILPTPEAA